MERPSRESPGIRVALLDCGTGEGHNSAAAALGEALDRRGVAWEEAKPLALDGKRLGPGVDRAYAWMIRSAPGLFNQIYKAGERLSCADRQSPVYRVLGRHCAPLGRWLRRGGFTHVICTHLFPMEMMTALRLSGQWELPCYGVLTDYTCIPFTEETRMDGYFIAHQDLVGEMVERGVPQGRIFPSGIPVREKFGKPQERTAARRALGLPSQGKLFLVMGGSAGCGKLEELCQGLLVLPGEKTVCVLTGRNERLRKKLGRTFVQNSALHIVPYTNQTEMYMAAAHVLITKPGGLSSTEAAALGVPLVHLLVYTACEEKNARFFADRGLSLRAGSPGEAVQLAWALAEEEDLRKAQRKSQEKYVDPHGADHIVEKVLAL